MEEINTGGLKKIKYEKDYEPELDDERTRQIEEGYKKAEKRKRKQKIFWIIVAIAIILLGILGFIFL